MLDAIEVRDFRNLEPLHCKIGAGAHLICGDNGAGKTSFLEAMYLLATTRSFRTSQVVDCRRHGAMGFSVRGEIDAAQRWRLETTLEERRLQRRVNGTRGTLSEHLAVLPVVCWASRDRDVLEGAPAQRRRFLDRGVTGLRPTSLEVMTRYRRALEEKRRLLQRGRASIEELRSWNDVLTPAAAQLVDLRSRYTTRLQEAFVEVMDLTGLSFPNITLRYRPSPPAAQEGPEALRLHLGGLEAREIQLERPLVGPHRDDLEIRWQGHGIRRVASAGERKALGLLLLAAQGRLLEAAGKTPLYLLDDMDTELDGTRLEALWRVFGAAQQVVATSNRPKIWSSIEGLKTWDCSAGTLTRGSSSEVLSSG